MTIGELIAKHNELLTFIEAERADVDTRLKPYEVGIAAIEDAIRTMLLAQVQNRDNLRLWIDTPKAHISIEGVGTAFLHTTMSVKVDNRDDFKQLVLTDWSFADLRCLKDPVCDWLTKTNGVPPPGIKVEFFTKCNIRRS